MPPRPAKDLTFTADDADRTLVLDLEDVSGQPKGEATVVLDLSNSQVNEMLSEEELQGMSGPDEPTVRLPVLVKK
jgi:hypothetical protein